MTEYNEEEELKRLHTIEDEREGIPRSTYGTTDFDPSNVTDESMFFLGQIKELQEELEKEIAEAAGESAPLPERKPALPARFTRKSSGWK